MTGRHDDSGNDLDADLRSMFRQMASDTDEEPDASGFASLMAAASSRVPVQAPSTWERAREWFSSLARQPAFAAVAMLLVVATVGGVLIAKGGKVAEQTAAPMENQSGPSVTANVDDGDRVFAEMPSPPAAAQVASAVRLEEGRQQNAEQSDDAELKVAAADRAPKASGNGDRDGAAKLRSKPSQEKSPARDVFADVNSSAGPRPVAPVDQSKSPSPPPSPPPPPPVTTAVTSTGAGGGRAPATKRAMDDSTVTSDADKKSDSDAVPTRSADERVLRAALARGDCAAVRKYVTRMKQTELSRYQQIVVETAIKRCLAS